MKQEESVIIGNYILKLRDREISTYLNKELIKSVPIKDITHDLREFKDYVDRFKKNFEQKYKN